MLDNYTVLTDNSVWCLLGEEALVAYSGIGPTGALDVAVCHFLSHRKPENWRLFGVVTRAQQAGIWESAVNVYGIPFVRVFSSPEDQDELQAVFEKADIVFAPKLTEELSPDVRQQSVVFSSREELLAVLDYFWSDQILEPFTRDTVKRLLTRL